MWEYYLLSFSFWVAYATYGLHWNENRDYLTEIQDPLYKYFPRFDASVPVMVMLYLCGIVFFSHWNYWDDMSACWSFNILICSRLMILYLHPFKGHKSMIPLKDIIIEKFEGVSQPLKNDLSFSGHVSTLVMFGFLFPMYQWLFWTCACLTGFCLICSRVHYSADCVMAPFFSFFAHSVHKNIQIIWITFVPLWVTLTLCGLFAGLICLYCIQVRKAK